MSVSNDVRQFLTEANGEVSIKKLTKDAFDIPKNKEKLKLCLSLIDEEVKELQEAIKNKDPFEMQDAIVDIQWVVNNIPYYMGINIQLMEYAVNLSNFSKFCPTEESAKETVKLYAEGKHPDKQGTKIECFYDSTPNGIYVVKRKSDEKIMKCHNYMNTRECFDRLYNKPIDITYVDKYTPEDCQNNPRKVYIFGDNFARVGKAGQAIIRDENNSFGICTKMSPGKYLSDENFNQYSDYLRRELMDLNNAIRSSLNYDLEIVFPKDGIGTGLAKMETKAPRCFKALNEALEGIFGIKNPLSTIITK